VRERGNESGGNVLLPPKFDKRVKPKPHPPSRTLRVLQVVSREVVLKRLTAPKVRISSVEIDFFLGNSIDGVGVKVWEEEPELEVVKRLRRVMGVFLAGLVAVLFASTLLSVIGFFEGRVDA